MAGHTEETPAAEFESAEGRTLSSLPTLALTFLESLSSSSFIPFQEAVSHLVRIAKSSKGRRKLANLQAVPRLVSVLNSFISSLLSSSSSSVAQSGLSLLANSSFIDSAAASAVVILLKALRNLCAGDGSNQDAFRVCKGVETLALLSQKTLFTICSVDKKSFHGSPPWSEFVTVLLQLLGNVAGHGDENKAAIWGMFFPDLMLLFCQVSLIWKEAQEPLCMLLFTCAHGCDSRLMELSEGKGAVLLGTILGGSHIQYSPDSDQTPLSCQCHDITKSNVTENEWMKGLVCKLCLERPYFPAIFANLGSSASFKLKDLNVDLENDRAKFRLHLEQQKLTTAQVNILYILCSVVYEDNEDEKNTMMHNSLVILVDIISHSAHSASLCGEACELPTGCPAIDVLGYSLLLARKLCAMETLDMDNQDNDSKEELNYPQKLFRIGETTASNPHQQNGTSQSSIKSSLLHVRHMLVSHGLVTLLLQILESLGPPDIVQKAMNSSVPGLSETMEPLNALGGLEAETDTVDKRECFTNHSNKFDKRYPSKNVYKGFRRDIVSIIANISYKNFPVQELLRENNGLLLLLQQCVVDSGNPFLREWSFWAVRNLLYDNVKNKQEVASLQLEGVVNTSEILQQTGLCVKIDPATQRPKLVNVTGNGGG